MTAEKSHHNAGWYAGALAFWLLTAWLITVGLSSIIPQIFWPGDYWPGVAGKQAPSCVDALRTLRGELLAQAERRFAAASDSDRERSVAFFEAWDARHDRMRAACQGAEHTAWTELARLRHGMEALLDRFDREQAPRLERLNELLGPSREARVNLPERTEDE